MKFRVLFTGSEGNCSLFTYKNTNILIDAGFKTKKKMEEILSPIMEKIKIDAVIITHEHNDHFSPWTGRLCMENNIPLYLHERHIEDEPHRDKKYLSFEDKRKNISMEITPTIIKENQPFTIKDIRIDPFISFHDAKKTLGFVINKKFAYLADCGFISSNIKKYLQGIKYLALEFNYEVNKLLNSNRHWKNKIRTMGKWGHLSNEEAIKFSKWLIEKGNLQYLITLHPSNSHCDLGVLREELKELGINCYVSEREKNDEIIFDIEK